VPDAKSTTKKLAQRIDLNYFKRPHPFRRWRFWLSVCVPILAVLWLGTYEFTGDESVYSGGQMSPSHALLATKCDTCHVKTAGVFSAKADDQACLSCHDGPIHHANQTFTPNCSSCHREHRGRVQLAATDNASCAQCHGNLRTTGAATNFVRDISDFGAGHPEFAAVRAGSADPRTIKLNHAIHMKHNLLGPSGPVQLDCEDCHRAGTSTEAWRFGKDQPGTSSGLGKSDFAILVSQRAYMQPVSFAKSCAGCHGLQFDKRFTEGAPHDTPEVIHPFLVEKFRQYIAAHPNELRVTDSERDLPQKPVPARIRILTPEQWTAERVADAEQLLWRKTCKQCHALNFTANAALPVVAKSNTPTRWFPHATFNHERHQMLKCAECHPGGLTSQNTADILVPGIATCQKCHHTGAEAAESRCFECHTYHDWTKEKSVKGKLTLTGLGRGK
jgi:hypothetical protein